MSLLHMRWTFQFAIYYKIATYYIFIPVYLLWVYCDFCKFVKEHFAQNWEHVINLQDYT